MTCKKCLEEIAEGDFFPNDHRYCMRCETERSELLKDRRATLASLRDMNLPSKIIQTKFLIRQAVSEFGSNKVYISYSGGKDSTVLSHIAKSMYPDILHLFSNTTNEYPETLQHIKWEQEENGTNLIMVLPADVHGEIWTFKKVVERYGYPVFSKRVSNAIRTYQHALSEKTRQHSIDYIARNFKNTINTRICPYPTNAVTG